MLTRNRWAALESLDNTVLGQKSKKATKFVSLEERTANKGKGKEGKGSPSRNRDEETEKDEPLAIEAVVQDRNAKADEVELFKVGGYERMKKAFRPENVPGPRYNTSALRSTALTDFSQSSDDTYWATNLELAEFFARYHQARNGTDIRAGMLHIIIPKPILESAVHFKTQEHWREFVWLNCIQGEIPGTSMSELIYALFE